MTKSAWRSAGAAAVLVLAGGLSACGVTDKMDETNRKMDTVTSNTGDMDGKMSATNLNIEETKSAVLDTNSQLADTNGKMDRLNEAVGETNAKMGQMASEMKSLESATVEMDRKMGVTNAAIHKQVLGDSMNELLKPENTRYLFPPTALLPAGRTFAEEATPDEMIQLTYAYLKDIDEARPDDSQRQPDGQFPPALIREMDHDKLAKLTILEVLAGFMPQPGVESLVDGQLTRGGRYDGAALSFLMLRTLFIHDILVSGDLFADKLDNLGKVQEGIDRVTALDWIARLPWAGEIALKTRGMLDPGDNLDEKLDSRMTVPLWDRLARALDSELDPAKVGDSPEARARIAGMKATVRKYRDSWKPDPAPSPSPAAHS